MPKIEPAAHDAADADAGAHRDIGVIVEAHRRAPATFGQRRAVDVGVEAHGNAEAPRQALRDVGIAPARLGGRGDEAVGGRVRAQIDRAERSDAQRAHRAMLLSASDPALPRSAAASLRARPWADARRARTSSGPVPRMHTHLVPPSSTPASSLEEGGMLSPWSRGGGCLARTGQPGIRRGEEAVVRWARRPRRRRPSG